eukprot:13139645-Heterocapsa_arctica.AAC.1
MMMTITAPEVLVAMLFKTNIFAMVTTSDDEPSNGGTHKVRGDATISGPYRCTHTGVYGFE